MALSPQDQDYYEQKLGVPGFLPFMGATMLIGAILWPLSLYMMDLSSGSVSEWTTHVFVNLITIGVMFGTIVSVVMNLIFRFLLWMEWLPPRH